MKRKLQGKYITTTIVCEKVKAFVPAPLPPRPGIEWTPQLHLKFDQAMVELGRLNGVLDLLPNTSLFLYTYIRKEAVLSSMIEGTQSSLSDLLMFELEQLPGVPLNDEQEVSNYVAALNHGIERLREGMPISLRLLREIHDVLLRKGRGSLQMPGEFRRSQNWIGGTRPGNASFVPPPPEQVIECMGQLELFLHDQPEATPVLLKAALVHLQFETIHPFLDGNGRLGRLLITLLLFDQGVLSEPMLYLSLYFKTHRQRYYELLNEVRLSGDWEAWLEFFADAVAYTAKEAVETAQKLLMRAEQDREGIAALGRQADSLLQVYQALMEHPVATSNLIVAKTGLTPATVNRCLVRLEQQGIVQALTDQKRNRLFGHMPYLEILNDDD